MQPPSLEQIWRDYHGKVSGFVYKKVNDPTVTEDLVSEIFLKITQNYSRYDPSKAAVSTWVYTIANNTVLDYYRTRRVFAELPDENGAEGLMPECLVDNTGLDENLLAGEQLEELAAALEALPERERDLIVLHYYGNLTLKDTAERMGMSYANAKLVHKKALAKLRDILS